jgi:hypothetical protein
MEVSSCKNYLDTVDFPRPLLIAGGYIVHSTLHSPQIMEHWLNLPKTSTSSQFPGNWEAKNAAKKIMPVKVCKKCGSRAMSPVIVSLSCQEVQGKRAAE